MSTISSTSDTSPPPEEYYIVQLHEDEANWGDVKWRLVIYKFYMSTKDMDDLENNAEDLPDGNYLS